MGSWGRGVVGWWGGGVVSVGSWCRGVVGSWGRGVVVGSWWGGGGVVGSWVVGWWGGGGRGVVGSWGRGVVVGSWWGRGVVVVGLWGRGVVGLWGRGVVGVVGSWGGRAACRALQPAQRACLEGCLDTKSLQIARSIVNLPKPESLILGVGGLGGWGFGGHEKPEGLRVEGSRG